MSKPNVVVFFTDQQRWDTAGCYGNPMNLTPVLDAMAARGTCFERAFTCQPVCGPARASLQTGLYANATGCFTNSIALRPGSQTLATLFGAQGYHTAYLGKWHLGGGRAIEPVRPEMRGGYDYWRASDLLEFTSHPYDGCVFDNDGKSVRLRGYRVDAMTDLAIEYLRKARREPFLLFVSYLEPHFQNDMNHFVAPDGFAERYRDGYVPGDLQAMPRGDWREELPGYYGICKSLDDNLGRMLGELDRLKLSDNTVVAFTSDHGCHFRTRNGEYKRSCHDSSIRIPMVLDGPGFRGGGMRDELVSLVDLPPTLVAAAGIAPLAHMHGRDLTRLAGGQSEGWLNEVFVQISENHVGRAIRTERWTYSVRAAAASVAGNSRADVYVEDCLYDVVADPHQLVNLAGRPESAQVRERLRRRIIERIVASGEPAPTIVES